MIQFRMEFEWGRAVCYSGYRTGQSPKNGTIPSEGQIKEDLDIIVAAGFRYIRMYDATEYAASVCRIIRNERIPLQVMLGPGLINEVNNTGCPWDNKVYTTEQLEERAAHNDSRIDNLAKIANEYSDVVFCVSVGNENTPDWGENTVPEARLVEFAERLRQLTGKPVTFNEGAREWKRLQLLASTLDIICIHSYPLWYGNTVEEAVAVNKRDYEEIKQLYPGKQVWFSEAGWATKSCEANAEINPEQPSESNQARYYKDFWEYTDRERIMAFVFEAFDEPWKGGANPNEVEKHWGLFYVNRTPKPVMSFQL